MGAQLVSIRDVARAAGVSTATVSRALGDGRHVRPQVRERVLAAVAELGYRPNLVARSLRARRSNTLGLVVADIRNPFFTAISRAVEDTAYARGFSVLLCNTDEDPQKEMAYLRLLRDANVAGIILAPTPRAVREFARVRRELPDMPLVVVDRAVPAAEVDVVLLDNREASERLTTLLITNGYRRIAALLGDVGLTGQERREGYERALRAHGLTPDPTLARVIPPTTEAGRTATEELLALAPAPDALLAGNSLLAAGAMLAIRRRNLVIPRDLALVSFDEATWESLVEPAITVIAQPTYDIGRTAAELALQRLDDPMRPARQVILRGRLEARGSSAPRQADAEQATAPHGG